MKKGFTLVELSIVLVIIGLLIGGILAAQSMISTTRALKTLDRLFQYEVATTNFITTYKQFPGDSRIFNPPGNNNNSSMDDLANCANEYEFLNAFAHLSQAGMIKETFIPMCNSPVVSPRGQLNSRNAGIVYPAISQAPVKYDNAGIYGTKSRVALVRDSSSGYVLPNFQVDLVPDELMTIEAKLGNRPWASAIRNGGYANFYGGNGLCWDFVSNSSGLCTDNPKTKYGTFSYSIPEM